jgi:hypothetical protein
VVLFAPPEALQLAFDPQQVGGQALVHVADEGQRHVGARHLQLEFRQLVAGAAHRFRVARVAALDAVLDVLLEHVDHPEQAATTGTSMTLIHQVGSICMGNSKRSLKGRTGRGQTLAGGTGGGLVVEGDVARALPRDLLPLGAAPADAGGRAGAAGRLKDGRAGTTPAMGLRADGAPPKRRSRSPIRGRDAARAGAY